MQFTLNEFSSIRYKVDNNVRSRNGINSDFDRVEEDLKTYIKYLQDMGVFINNVASDFAQVETGNAARAEDSMSAVLGTAGGATVTAGAAWAASTGEANASGRDGVKTANGGFAHSEIRADAYDDEPIQLGVGGSSTTQSGGNSGHGNTKTMSTPADSSKINSSDTDLVGNKKGSLKYGSAKEAVERMKYDSVNDNIRFGDSTLELNTKNIDIVGVNKAADKIRSSVTGKDNFWQESKKTGNVDTGKRTSTVTIGNRRGVTAGKPEDTRSTAQKAGDYIKDTAKSVKNKITSKLNDHRYLTGVATQAGAAATIGAIGSGIGKGITKLAEGMEGKSYVGEYGYEKSGAETTWRKETENAYYEASAKAGTSDASARAESTFDPAGGNIKAQADASANLTGASVSAAAGNKNASVAASASVGNLNAAASAKASLMENGQFNPTIYAAAGAEASVAKAQASAQVRHDSGIGAGVNAQGSIGSAKAAASMVFDPAKGNVMAEAGAMVAAASGNVTGSVDLGIIKGDVTLTGYAGAAGVGVKAGIKDGKLHLGGYGALGIGGGIDFSVGIGSAGEAIEAATGGMLGDAVSAVGNTLSGVLAPVNAVVGAAKNAVDTIKSNFNNNVKENGAVVGTLQTVGEAVATGAIAAGAAIKDGAKAVAEGVKSAAQAVGKAAVTVGKGVVEAAKTVGNGIATGFKKVGSFLKGLFS
jgi:hypothetical protein